MRRFVALALVLTLLTSTVGGCSQPIDTGSSVPAQSQPIVALVALVALGIGVAAWHHHNEHRGAGPGVTIIAPAQVISPLLSGYNATQLAADAVNSGIGVLEVPQVGGQPTRFALISIAANTFSDYALATGYAPIAMTVDGNGIDWFVDASGKVQGCDAPATGVLTCSTAGIGFPTTTDGLGAGARAVAADQFNLVVVRDGGGGKVDYFAFNFSTGSHSSGQFQSTSTSPLFATDEVESTPPSSGVSGFAVYHADGKSDLITLSPPTGSPNFTFSPQPAAAPSDLVQAVDFNAAFYAATGSVGGTYQLTRFENPNPTGIGQLTTKSILIASGGQTGDPVNKPWAPPLASVHADGANDVWALDASSPSPEIVEFAPF